LTISARSLRNFFPIASQSLYSHFVYSRCAIILRPLRNYYAIVIQLLYNRYRFAIAVRLRSLRIRCTSKRPAKEFRSAHDYNDLASFSENVLTFCSLHLRSARTFSHQNSASRQDRSRKRVRQAREVCKSLYKR
jgi:hypothetical protein